MLQLPLSFGMSARCAQKGSGMYKLSEAHHGTNPYWVDSVRPERFKGTLQSGFLYRPAIVNGLCSRIQDALNSSVREGVMVKGPHGVGKSHSLVNTVLKFDLGHGVFGQQQQRDLKDRP